jgi:uncharacterized protein YaiL (DUF2058 family)
MGDLKDQLRKAGLVSEKEIKRARHQERVHATEVGRAGIEAERRETEERARRDAEERRLADRRREEERRRSREEEAARSRGEQTIRGSLLADATGGSRRFFFETHDGAIRFLDLSDSAARKLATGTAAIIESRGLVRGDYCLIDARAASEIETLFPRIVCFWNRV